MEVEEQEIPMAHRVGCDVVGACTLVGVLCAPSTPHVHTTGIQVD